MGKTLRSQQLTNGVQHTVCVCIYLYVFCVSVCVQWHEKVWEVLAKISVPMNH